MSAEVRNTSIGVSDQEPPLDYPPPGTAPLPSYAELFAEDTAPKPCSTQDPSTSQPPLQASDTTQPQIVEVVVQQPHVHSVATNYGRIDDWGKSSVYIVYGFAVSCLVVSIICFFPAVVCSLPAAIYANKSLEAYKQGDTLTSQSYGWGSMRLNALAMTFFSVSFVVICIILGATLG